MTAFRALFLLWLSGGFSSLALAQNLLQTIPPSVQRGMEAYKAERFEKANEAFEEAQTHMPSNAQLEFNRGTTFFKQQKYSEALQSFSRAQEWDDGKLRGDVFYNMGNAYAAMGKAADAMAAYRQALRVNPQDAMARNNLEFLLSQPPPPPQETPQDKDTSQEKDASDDDSASSQQSPRDNPAAPPPSDNENNAPEKPDNSPQDANPPKPEDAKQNNAPEETAKEEALEEKTPQDNASRQQGKRFSREEADKLLDAFGMDEKSYEAWRFQKKPPVEEWQYEKDW